MPDYQRRRRLSAMRDTQRTALAMFESEGFDTVTVEDIAAAVGMAPSTIYRHFGTKEQLVLWDEETEEVAEMIGELLGALPPLAAVRDALVAVLGRWQDDEFQRRRLAFVFATGQLHAAAAEADAADRAQLTEAIADALPAADRPVASLLAGVALLALDVAFERWQAGDSDATLGEHIVDSFAALEQLDRFS